MPNNSKTFGPILGLTLLLQLILFSGLPAKSRTPQQAKYLSQLWLQKSGYFQSEVTGEVDWHLRRSGSDLMSVLKASDGSNLAFVLRLEPSGFILVSADDRLNPILAFSREADFDASPTERNFAIQWIEKDISNRLKAISEANAPTGLLKRNRRFYEELTQEKTPSAERKFEIFGPYLSTQWGQGNVEGAPVFNLMTPNHWSAGCVATALAQLLYFYKWPVHGSGSHRYNENDAGTIDVNFDSTYYDWPNMLEVYTLSSTEREREAVAKLMFHCGVALNMDYESTGSTASTRNVPAALADYFRFAGLYEKSSTENFYQDLKQEMIEGRPAQLAISTRSGLGHSVDVDGYFEHNGYFHLNMGWNGKNNGWYDLAGSFYVSGYSIVDGAVLQVFPVPEILDSLLTLRNDSVRVAWRKSFRSYPEKYELAYSLNGEDNWVSFSSALRDTAVEIFLPDLVSNNNKVGSVLFRVRAFEKEKWWGWSQSERLQIQAPRRITFQVRLGRKKLAEGEQLVVRGNIPPLGGYVNSAPFTGPDSAGIFRLTVSFDYSHVGETLLYRFAIVGPGGVEMENKTRQTVISGEPSQVLPVVYFNDEVSQIPQVAEEQAVRRFRIYPNYPNPFRRETRLRFDFPENKPVRLAVFNILGEKIATYLIPNENPGKSGFWNLDFAALKSVSGRPLPKGIYLVEFQAAGQKRVQKILFQ